MLKFKIISISEFSKFLKRYSSIQKDLLLEITPSNVKAKAHTPERNILKFSSIDIKDIFDVGDSVIPKLVKVPLLNYERISKALKMFSEDESIDFIITYHEVQGETLASEIRLKSATLELSFECANITLINYVDDKVFETLKNLPSDYDVTVTESFFGKISSLSSLNEDKGTVEFLVKDGDLKVRDKSFVYSVADGIDATVNSKTSILKEHLKYIDAEESKMKSTDKGLIFSSNLTNTSIIVAKAS